MKTKISLYVVLVVGFAAVFADSANAFYAPHMGRFVNRDPNGQMPSIARVGAADPTVQYDDGMNLYQYVQGNPAIATDPNGLKSKPSFCQANWRRPWYKITGTCTVVCNCPGQGPVIAWNTDDNVGFSDEKSRKRCEATRKRMEDSDLCGDDDDDPPEPDCPRPLPDWMNEPGLRPCPSPFGIAACFLNPWKLIPIPKPIGNPIVLPFPKPGETLPIVRPAA